MTHKRKYAKPSVSTPTLMRVAFVLLCLLMLSVYLMGGLLAKYNATGSGSDSARVAKFDVDVAFSDGTDTIEGIEATLHYNQDAGSYTITVVNYSEVAISYKIRVEDINFKTEKDGEEVRTSTATGGFSVQLKTGDTADKKTLNYGVTPYAFGEFQLAHGPSTQSHILTFPVDTAAFESLVASQKGSSVSVTITFKVVVDVTQVD